MAYNTNSIWRFVISEWQRLVAHCNNDLILHLGWESCQHVGDMLARQPNVGTFGQHPLVVVTQKQSRHSIFVLGIADIHPICILVPELHTKNSSVNLLEIFGYYIRSDGTFLLLSTHKCDSPLLLQH
jgi:hypothetical protein